MTAKWESCAVLVVCLSLVFGCRTPQPNLKPPKEPEKLVAPPPDARYDTSSYPQVAFDKPVDPGRAALDSKNTPGMPQRGSMMPAGGMSGH